MKGIILAGGKGTRLYPLTRAISKQILPVYDKPMIYYPLSTLMLANIRDILIISTPRDIRLFEELLHDGSQLGLSIQYAIQEEPRGLAEAFIIGKDFIGNDNVALILGDNIFYGQNFIEAIQKSSVLNDGAIVFGYKVENPREYGVVVFDSNKKVLEIEEKPQEPKSNYAVPGLYFYDNKVVDIVKNIKPSKRNELEITSINNEYLKLGKLNVELLDDNTMWIDTGSHENLLKASEFVANVQKDNYNYISCIEEIAFLKGYINKQQLSKLSEELIYTNYGKHIKELSVNGSRDEKMKLKY